MVLNPNETREETKCYQYKDHPIPKMTTMRMNKSRQRRDHFKRRECLHDWQEISDTTCLCRLCGEAKRWDNMPASNDTVMMKAYGMTFMVPMKCLPESFQRTIEIRRNIKEGN